MTCPWFQIVTPVQAEHTATVIFFHGVGETPENWLSIIHPLTVRMPYAKWIMPNANTRPMTALGGAISTAWSVTPR
jgi:lysophospholipase-2